MTYPVAYHTFTVTALLLLSLAVVGPNFVLAEHSSPVHLHGHHASKQTETRAFLRTKAPTGDLRDDLRTAINIALGAGNSLDKSRLQSIRGKLWPMWQSLAKNEHDRVDRRSLRYAVHRYLLHQFSISVIGLEPLHANGSHDEAQLLTKYMPAYVRTVLEGQAAGQGFSLDDAVAMIVALERLVEDSSFDILEAVYAKDDTDVHQALDEHRMLSVMEDFMLRWMLGDDMDSIRELEANHDLRESSFEDWGHIAGFAHGRVRNFEYSRRFAKRGADRSWTSLEPRFTFEDAKAIAGSVTTSFGRFWETECARVKESLVKMDHGLTGRVKLSDFHAAALAGEWRFSESKDYLKQLGALDESSSWNGPQVIITNYLQSPSNCIVYSPHYRVCCANECEDVLGEIEAAVSSPLAVPEEILRILANVTVSLEDEAPKLKGSLTSQLHEIAKASGGKIPIHGRLFSQWLHYAYPHQCSFPHKSGTTTTLAPLEYGDEYMATSSEMETHAEAEPEGLVDSEGQKSSDNLEDEWMSQWSHDEELLTDNLQLSAPWETTLNVGLIGFFLTLVLGLAALVGKISSQSGQDPLPAHYGSYGGVKSHMV